MNTPPPSPTTNSSSITKTVPITVAPLPNIFVGVSQPRISIALSTPFYDDSTATKTSTVSTSMSTINVLDTVVGATFCVTVGPNTSPTSTLREDDPDIMYGDDQDDFQNFVFIPFTIHPTSNDDESPMRKG